MSYIYDTQDVLFGEPECVGFGDDDFAIKQIHRDQANAIIRRNHYSKKTYAATYIHLGVFIDGEILGVLQFGYAMNPASAGSVVEGTGMKEYLELNRMWLDDFAPKNSESRALSFSIKYIRRAFPAVRWIQSFADERCGLFGTVYQAANFDYCGEHTATFWELDGVVYHNSIMTDSRKVNTPAGKTLLQGKDRAKALTLRQFRYIFFMKPRFRKGLLHELKPYPKPNYAARLVDERPPGRESKAQTLGAAPTFKDDNG